MNFKWYISIFIVVILIGCYDRDEPKNEGDLPEIKKTVFDPDTINWGESEIDSIRVRLTLPIHDTDRVISLNNLAWEISLLNVDSAIAINERSLELSERINYKKGILQSLTQLGTFHTDKGELEQVDDVCVIGIKL